MIVRGRAWKFGDNISTDLIIPGKYKFSTLDFAELAKHAMEGADPAFARKVRPGDVVVAGKNFGCGSSREHAPLVLKHAGVGAVVAKSFARIFFRNSVNVGLPVVISPEAYDVIDEGDVVSLSLREGVLVDETKNVEIRFKPLPDFLLEILSEGGLVEYYKKHRRFPWE
ncbi:MAG: 3-isopropylmalate dehydratase small subunit [Fervidicoccaceae archaeon]